MRDFQRIGRKGVLLLLALAVFFLTAWAGSGLPRAEAMEIDGGWQYQAVENDSRWQPYVPGSQPLRGTGHRVLWLRATLLPDHPEKDTMLFSTTMKSIRIWVDGQVIYNYGAFGQSYFGDGARWHLVKLPRISAPTDIYVQVYYDDAEQRVGMFRTMRLETGHTQVERLFQYDMIYVVTMPIAAIIIGMMMVLYWFNTDKKMKPLYLSVSAFMLTFLLWALAASNIKELLFDAPLFWWEILCTTAYLLPITANCILYCVLREEPEAHVELVIGANVLLMFVAVSLELMGKFELNRMMNGFYLALVIGEGVSFYWLVRAARRGNILSRAVLPATAAFTVLGLFDGIGAHFGVFAWTVFLTPFGIYAFLLFVAGILKTQLVHEAKLTQRAEGLKCEVEEATELSERDALTACYNRTVMHKLFMRAKQASVKQGQPFSALMLDIDHFKRVNDEHGHDAGDIVLRDFAHTLQENLDASKYLIRWGGEEFFVLLPCRDLIEAAVLGNRLRRAIERGKMGGLSITCSIGAAVWHEKDTDDAFFRRVDRAMYQAKKTGRNRVCLETDAEG